MADNILKFGLGWEDDGFKKGLADAGDDLKEATKKVKELGSQAKESAKDLKDINGSDVREAVSNLNQGVVGVGEQLVKVGKAAKVGGTALKSALSATGVGLLIVALQTIVENWDAIKDAINGSNAELEKQKDLLDKIAGLDNTKLKRLQKERDLLKAQGQDTSAKENEINAQFQKRIDLQKDIIANADALQKASEIDLTKATIAELRNITALGKVFNIFSDDVEEVQEELIKYATGAEKAKTELASLRIEQVKFNQAIAKSKIPKPTGTPTSPGPTQSNGFDFGNFADFDQATIPIRNLTVALDPLISKFNTVKLAAFTFKDALIANFQELNDITKEILADFTENTLGDVGTALGQALAEGTNVLQSIGQTLLQSLGDLFSTLGGLFIKYGLAAAAFAKATKGLSNPATAGPSAVALIAAGVALKAIGGAISSIGSGGGGGGSSAGGGGPRGNTTVNTGGGGFGSGTVVFEIAGTKLLGVLNRTLNANQNLSGNITVG